MKRIHHRVNFPELNAGSKEDWWRFFADHKVFPEIYFSGDDLDVVKAQDIQAVAEELSRNRLGCSIHAPFLDLSPGAFDSKIREATLQRLLHTLDIADVLHPNIVNVHAHYEKHRFGWKMDQWLGEAEETFEPLVRRAEKSRTVLTVENTFEEEPTVIERLLKAFDSPNLRACFDVGHFHMFHKIPLKAWWTALGKRISLLHIHDNHGDRDEHLVPGEGNFPFPAYFNLLKDLKHEMTITVECRNLEDAQKGVRIVRRFLGVKP